jgi:cysteine synthase
LILVDPHACNTLADVHEKHRFEGMNVGVRPPFLDASLISDVLKVKNDEALAMQTHFAVEHGYYLGMTSAACLAAAQRVALDVKDDKNTCLVNMAYDLGFWYEGLD